MIKLKNTFAITRQFAGHIFKAFEEKLVPEEKFLDAAGNLIHEGLSFVEKIEKEIEENFGLVEEDIEKDSSEIKSEINSEEKKTEEITEKVESEVKDEAVKTEDEMKINSVGMEKTFEAMSKAINKEV